MPASAHGRTIQIYLPDGNPRGIRVADMTSRTIQVMYVPRPMLDEACALEELPNIGLYFLVGEPDAAGQAKVYVGETEECAARLRQHNRNKEFWNAALLIGSKTQFFTKSHIKYLEWLSCEAIDSAGRFALENGNVPTKSFVSRPVEADLLDNFETIKVLVSTLGFPFFDTIAKPVAGALLHCSSDQVEATGEYTDDGFVIFSGSTARLTEAPSATPWVSNLRGALIQSGSLVPEGGLLRFTKDHVFSSPSAAAVTVLGRTANGWTEWKYSDGRTLDEVKRRNAASDM